MIKLSIPHKENSKASLPEQASGFPPFTRGYHSTQQNVKLVTSKTTDYLLKDYQENSIIDLFSIIISRQAKGKLTIELPFNGKPEEVIYIRVLRTLASLVSEKLYKTSTAIQFEFYGNTTNSSNKILTTNFAKAAQVDFLIVKKLDYWQQTQLYSANLPVDSFYGSNFLEEETSIIFLRLWSKIKLILA